MSGQLDGGPAFPAKGKITLSYGEIASARGTEFELSGGMSLRDWFAANALSGMYASDTQDWNNGHTPEGLATRAASAYQIADAMLAERAKKAGAA